MERNEVMLSSRFKLPGQFVFAARARMFADHVTLAGWTFSGRFERRLSIADMVDVEWFTAAKGQPNLRIIMRDGSEHFVWLPQAGLWCYELRRLARLSQDAATIPSARKGVANAA